MARKQPETLLLGHIREAMTKRGCKNIKIHGDAFTEKGTPDVIGSYLGLCIAIEVKVPGEDAEPIQKVRLREWKDAGARTGVAHSVDEALGIMEGKISYTYPKGNK